LAAGAGGGVVRVGDQANKLRGGRGEGAEGTEKRKRSSISLTRALTLAKDQHSRRPPRAPDQRRPIGRGAEEPETAFVLSWIRPASDTWTPEKCLAHGMTLHDGVCAECVFLAWVAANG
jgi:hypothetical protein